MKKENWLSSHLAWIYSSDREFDANVERDLHRLEPGFMFRMARAEVRDLAKRTVPIGEDSAHYVQEVMDDFDRGIMLSVRKLAKRLKKAASKKDKLANSRKTRKNKRANK